MYVHRAASAMPQIRVKSACAERLEPASAEQRQHDAAIQATAD
jgi:hypothetical protein